MRVCGKTDDRGICAVQHGYKQTMTCELKSISMQRAIREGSGVHLFAVSGGKSASAD